MFTWSCCRKTLFLLIAQIISLVLCGTVASTQHEGQVKDSAPSSHTTLALKMLTNVGEARFDHYLEQVLRSVRQKWKEAMPDSAIQGEKGRVDVEFWIEKDGSLAGHSTKMVVSSGNKALDDGAVAAIRSAAPFGPLPESFLGSRVELRLTFFYNQSPLPRP